MRVACLFSGGKDSSFAAYKAFKEGHEIRALVTLVPKHAESYMFHYPNLQLTPLQAKLMRFPHVMVDTEGEKEKELVDLRLAISRVEGIEGVVSGALASVYQKKRVDAVCQELGLESIAPLWKRDPETNLREELAEGFEVIFTGIAADGLDESWLGRKLDEDAIRDLKRLHKKYGIHIGGEGGEFESFVLNCPLFDKPIRVKKAHRVMESPNRGFYEIEEVETG
ncbi:diphthine--ammonia ligase [Candidatus Micrarchaeota archaeon]|nr:diphthine--ammonia ligase [Candidatus Micrarchaeota archaeon]